MRKTFILLMSLALMAGSCKKDDKELSQAEIDDKIINDYLTEKSISAIKDESGMYYVMIKEGNGGHPGLSNTVVVDYKGYFTDGKTFDEANSAEFKLSQVITGFQIGVGLLKPGGSATLFLPSALAYGNKQVGDIPPNSVLIFDVELVEFY